MAHVLAEHRAGAGVHPDRRLLRGAEIALVSLRDSQVKALADARQARRDRSPSCTATPTGSWPPSRSASPWPASCPPRSAARRSPTTWRRCSRTAGCPTVSPTSLGAGRHHARHLVRLARARRAGAQAARAAAGRGLLAAGRRRTVDRIARRRPAGHLAAVDVDRRRGAAARRRPDAAARGDHRRGAARAGRRARRRSARRSGRSSRTSSRPATGSSAR